MAARDYDTVVIGAGNAALSAAVAAHNEGARVLVLERSSQALRGGNTYFTGGLFRFPFDGLDTIRAIVDLTPSELESIVLQPYSEDDFFADIARVTEYLADPDLADHVVTNAYETLRWLKEQGIRFILTSGVTVGGKLHFEGNLVIEAVGGGAGLSDNWFEVIGQKGIEVWYETRAVKLLTADDNTVAGVRVKRGGRYQDIKAPTVVLACGGYEASPEMRARYLGPNWDLVKVRGTPCNTGDGIKMALELGAELCGHWSGCHSVQWDANSPAYGDKKLIERFHKHQYIFGILVNQNGERFLDEAADHHRYTYAKYGREVLKQPGRIAFQVFDQQVADLLKQPYWLPQVSRETAHSLEELAGKLGIPVEGFVRTVREFNAAVQDTPFDPSRLDGKRTRGLSPDKSNWALRIEKPPFIAYPVTCGITFTFGGVRTNTRAEVIDQEGVPIPGLFVAGEMVGGLWYNNYPSGSGLMAGAVFGRTAGVSAARYATAAARS